jgi:hypothetical protein
MPSVLTSPVRDAFVADLRALIGDSSHDQSDAARAS